MTGLVLRRLVQLPVVLLAVYTLTFMLAWLIPGSPLEKSEGRRPPPEIQAAMAHRYDLDDPWTFYWSYLGRATGVTWLMDGDDAHGPVFDFGPSLRHENWSVNEILAGQLPVSMVVGLSAIILAVLLGVSVGLIGGLRPGTALDLFTHSLSVTGVSIPAFVVGTVLLLAGGVWTGLFPVGGWGTLSHIVLPATALSLPFAAYISRLTRAGVIEEMQADYVRTARAKGLPERTVVLRHVLPNALLPVVSYLGPATAAAMTGSFVIEKVFAIPGLGMHFVDAVLGKDLTMIMGVVLVYATILVLMNLLVDVLYAWLDPRTQTA